MRHRSLVTLVTFVILSAACSAGGTEPSRAGAIWTGTPPVGTLGATSIDLTLSLQRPARVTYSIYASAQSLTADQLREDAAGLGGRTPLSAGTLTLSAGPARHFTVDSLPPGTTLFAYLTALPRAGDPEAPDSATVLSLNRTLYPLQPAANIFATSLAATIGYYWYAPESYYKDTTTVVPLLIFLHGSGEKGNGTTELSRVKVHGPPKLIEQRRALPFLVISPQLPTSSGGWPAGLVKELIDSARVRFRVDTTRIYVTGLSLGGFGAWYFAAAYPAIPAAIVPIAGAGPNGSACAMKDVPVWAFHGDADGTVNYSGSTSMVAALNACSPGPSVTPKLTIYPGVGHDSWTRTYDGSAGHDIYSWLLSYHR
jgi:hypothetical protein